MKTVCHKQLSFKSLFGKEIIACFDGGRMTSDGGGLLLREIDERYGVTAAAVFCMLDLRDWKRTIRGAPFIIKKGTLNYAR